MSRRRMSALVLTAAVAAVSMAAPAHAGTSGALFGASVSATSGETFSDAVARQDARYGTPTPMPISRVFYSGGAQPWPGKAGASGRPVVVSFKYAPAEVLKGTYDTALSSFFAGAPKNYDVFWSYLHEPEDDVARGEFTAADYRGAWQRIAGLAGAAAAQTGNIHLRSTLILMCYTVNTASGRNWRDYYVPAAQSMLAFDCFNHAGKNNRYGDPSNLFRPVTDWSAANPTLAWGIAEFGSTLSSTDTSGSNRAAWLRSAGTFLAGQHAAKPNSAVFGLYFDTVGPSGTDYRLTDSPSQNAWRDVVQGY